MGRLSRHPWCWATALVVPLLTLASPAVLKLAGVGPSWAVLWLLPWALMEDRASATLAALALGLMLDGLHGGPVSQIPALLVLGWWWSGIEQPGGRRIQGVFNLALLALLGGFLLDLSLLLQWLVHDLLAAATPGSMPLQGALGRSHATVWSLSSGWRLEDLSGAGLHILFAQTLLTALLAPMLCSLQLLFWRRVASGWRP